MPPVDHVIAPVLPEALRLFMRESCGIAVEAFHPLPGDRVPEPARQLLVHANDMTSTLATFHESPLRVEVLQQRRDSDLYLREVFLRTTPGDVIVEYGVIAIALDQFTPPQQAAVEAGQTPLGGLLHRFNLAFESAPIGFFSVPPGALAPTPLKPAESAPCFGRFNRLTKPAGAPLAWILEILPHGTG